MFFSVFRVFSFVSVVQLSVGLIGGNGDGIGEVDAACMGSGHGDFEEVVVVLGIEGFGESGAFAAKDEGVARLKGHLVEAFFAMRA